MTLRARGRLALGAVALAFLVLGSITVVVFINNDAVRRETVDGLYPAGAQVSALLAATADAERGVWGYAISSDPAFLTPYISGQARARTGFSQLRTLLNERNPELVPMLDAAEQNWQRWTDDIAEPRIAEVAAGDAEQALQQIAIGVGRRAFNNTQSDLALLQQDIDERLSDSVTRLTDVNRRLALAMIITATFAIFVTAATTLAMLNWVLKPLGELRAQMRTIVRDNDTSRPLEPSGPPEIYALGTDAEVLRQSLVAQIDQTNQANEGLAQESPTVSTIRALLRGPDEPAVPGWAIGVAALSSEGSLTGDWWDLVVLPGQRHVIEVSDITGHDASAGVLAARFKAAIHASLRSGVSLPESLSLAAVSFAMTPDRFASYVAVELAADHLSYVNAGHNPPLLVHAEGSVTPLAGTGPLVTSISRGWREATVPVAVGDVLVLYTDGLSEARDAEGDEIGDERVQAWATTLATTPMRRPPEQRATFIARGLVDRARAESEQLRRDDVMVVVAIAIGCD